MNGDTNISAIASVLADPGRCRVLAALGDGRALPASMLAAEAGVAPSTASEHLSKLVRAGLLTVERHSRHRYFRLAGPDGRRRCGRCGRGPGRMRCARPAPATTTWPAGPAWR